MPRPSSSLALLLALLAGVSMVLAPATAPVSAQDPQPAAQFPPVLDTAGMDRTTPRSIDEARRLEGVVQRLAEAVRPAAVGLRVGRAGGSGTIISPDGWIATAAHVTERVGIECRVFLSDGTEFRGRTMGLNRPRDYALIKFDPGDRKLPYVNMGDSDRVAVGQWVVSMGHPLGTETNPFRPPVVRLGRVSRNSKYQIVGDGPLISGDSGGPMFTLNGELIGINVSIQIANARINNATPINLLKDTIDRLKAGDRFGGDGASSADLQQAIESAYGLLEDAVATNDQTKFKGAEKAFQDAIKMDETSGDSWYHLACCYTRWSLSLQGDDAQAKVDAALIALNKAVEKGWENLDHMSTDQDMDPIRDTQGFRDVIISIRRKIGQSAYLGLSGEMTDGRFTVTSVGEKGPAERAGILVGDVVTRFNDRQIDSRDDLADAVTGLRPGDSVELVVERAGEELTLVVVLSGRANGDRVVTTKDDASFRTIFASVCEPASRSTVRVAANRRATGLGVIVRADGLILCKNSDLGSSARNITVIIPHGDTVAAERVAYDDQLDLALLKAEVDGLSVAPLAETSDCPIGSWVFSVAEAVPFVIGVRSLDEYRTMRAGDVPYMGIEGRELQGFAAQTMGVDAGILITRVEIRTGADRAGLREGDVIYQINETPIRRMRDLGAVLRDRRVGDTLNVEIMRNQEPKRLRVTLGRRPGTDDDGGLGGLFQRGGANRIKGPTSRRDAGFGVVIQHDGIVLPAQCGGPIVNIEGKVIGMNIGRSDRTKTYALPVEVLRAATQQLIERADLD